MAGMSMAQAARMTTGQCSTREEGFRISDFGGAVRWQGFRMSDSEKSSAPAEIPFHPHVIIPEVKARVFVSLKRTVLDPQGQTVRSALTGLGYRSVSEVRQGKFFDIALTPGVSPEEAHKEIDALARDVLTNPVIEEYQVEITE